MEDSETIDCGHFVEGRCKGNPDLVFLRSNDCKNEIKDTCCYVCKLREKCQIRCDLFDGKEREKKSFEFSALPEEERIKIGYDVLSRIYLMTGVLLFVTGLLFIAVWEAYSGNYLKTVQLSWELFRVIPTWLTFFTLLGNATPLILALLGGFLVFRYVLYGTEKPKENEKRLEPDLTIDVKEKKPERPKPRKVKKECGNCAYYFKPNCPRDYSIDTKVWRTQKTCKIFKPKTDKKPKEEPDRNL